MADIDDKTGTEEEDFVILDAPPEDDKEPEAQIDGQAADEDEEDERLETSQDDHDTDVTTGENRKRRQERRERQRQAREKQEAELNFLRQQVAQLSQRVGAQESHTLTAQEQQIVDAYNAAAAEARQAEQIMAKAIEAGNGEDSVAAQRIRDAAIARAQQAQGAYSQFQQAKQQAAQPAVRPDVQSHAQEWMAANPWYDARGGDEDSAIVNAIDAQMTQQGFDPSQRGYWEELTRRVAGRLAPADTDAAPARKAPANDGRRKAPPQGGGSGEYVPNSTRREIYVTPERKQAMVDAGVWDDPVARNRMLKAYSEYDRQNTAR